MRYLFIFLWINLVNLNLSMAQNLTPAQIVQKQFDAYNQRNLEAFLEPYADNVQVFMFPNKLVYDGKKEMKVRYKESFANTSGLHATLISRSILGNTVIDNEYIVSHKNKVPTELLVIYKIKNQKIVAMYWLPKEEY